MIISDAEVDVIKSWYNKTKVGPDGITHTIDTETQYPLYKLNINKIYYNLDNKEQVVNEIIGDLREIADHLQEMRDAQYEQEKGLEIDF